MKYLLDTNVLKELSRPKPHEHVAAWLDSVDDQDLAISAITVREISKGIEKKRTGGKDDLADALSADADRIFAAYSGRILPVDEAVAHTLGRRPGAKRQAHRRHRHRRDRPGARSRCRHTQRDRFSG